MSGPTMGEELYETHTGSLSWDRSTVADLRDLAERVEDGHLIGDGEIPNQPIANELREVADQIEGGLHWIEQATGDDYNQLVKALQYNLTGDYGPSQVREAWEEYGDG